MRFRITAATTARDIAAASALFRAYAASLDVDLAYQDFEAEMAGLPGRYAPPNGAVLLARNHKDEPVGCVGLRPVEPPGCCEMKRLYVAPAARGTGLGRQLVEVLMREAERIGYREVRLDTLPSMAGAQALYRGLGFEAMPPYYDTPIPGTVFMRRRLSPVPG